MPRNKLLRLCACSTLLISTAFCFGQGGTYFPEQVLGDDAQEAKFKVEWYSKFLTGLHEPSLWESSKNQKTETYRFLWLRSFDHPISVRLDTQSDGTALLTTKISSGHGGYEPGKLIENRARKLNREQTRWFLDRVEELKFCSLPTTPPKDARTVGLDGAQWILEGVKDTQYHVVDRWSPDNGAVRTLGLAMLIDLAHLKLLYQEVY